MADHYSTRVCQVCASAYPAKLIKSGKPRKTKHSYCSAECAATDSRARALSYYHQKKRSGGKCGYCGNGFTSTSKRTYCSAECRKTYNTHKAKVADKPPCSVKGCESKVAARGLCSKHYRWLMTHGSTDKPPRKPRKLKRLAKPCSWCGASMVLKPSIAKSQRCCSNECKGALRSHEAGSPSKPRALVCKSCHREVLRKVRTVKDSAKYCSRECAFDLLKRVAAERNALHRIGNKRRLKEDKRRKRIAPEVAALRRIGYRIRTAIRECAGCGKVHVRRWAFSRFCSELCRANHQNQVKAEYKTTESYRACRRKAKSRRRAMMRSAGKADSIDPIAVFERDKWRCHLCGTKTPQRLRGTLDNRAPELEHIVSLADGGTHTWGNVACSCRKCNQDKGAGSLGQLGLAIM